jgi:hypothetical protein
MVPHRPASWRAPELHRSSVHQRSVASQLAAAARRARGGQVEPHHERRKAVGWWSYADDSGRRPAGEELGEEGFSGREEG